MVERQSAPCKKWVTSVVPFAREPNIMALWEMDLSPGISSSPLNGYMVSLVILFLQFSDAIM